MTTTLYSSRGGASPQAPLMSYTSPTSTYAAPTSTYAAPTPTAVYASPQVVGYGYDSMVREVQLLRSQAAAEADRNMKAEALLRHEIELLKQRLAILEAPPQISELERRVREIESHGNIRVDLNTGRVDVIREIMFVPRQTTQDPHAEFADPRTAGGVLDDIAAVASIFGDKVNIEGHTRGGESDFWQALADDRARLVGEELMTRGIDRSLLYTKGFPGKRGLNRVHVVIKLTMGAMRRRSFGLQ
eukprot:gnl/TRDRNA2_/TRDRNA2_48162_c0_seq1.p1 gnl/TRDRNA2_/TRDRNA2_48162_c0~~gnl/TRDRNA2_/TRDRNA2_48162_c0_seq1.p1  ORF type:complete len:257 (+),score=47.00 gnl/TRDRNA2_/TRDRNA2_48162_c0_seq1:39-773(+)